IDTVSVAELAGLDAGSLSDEELDRAFRASLKFDARELAGKFARLITQRPANPALPDRYPYFNHLIQMAQTEGDSATVMALLDEAQRADSESNQGRRQGDYTLRRGQLFAKRGEIDQAHDVFGRLLSENADELRYYGPAIEAMLGQK